MKCAPTLLCQSTNALCEEAMCEHSATTSARHTFCSELYHSSSSRPRVCTLEPDTSGRKLEEACPALLDFLSSVSMSVLISMSVVQLS